MSEEHACLVRAHSDSENSSKLGSLSALARTMAYTNEKITGTEGSGEPANILHMTSPVDEHAEANDNGELIDYNDSSMLEQFHEDALRQSGCGLSQARVALATSLAVAGGTIELAAVPFILPSAEIELCILSHEKDWLVMITKVGSALGAVGWGLLAGRLGRRRTLMSCLAVNVVFAAIAAFMPTYGTFMMARFCSALGSGGILPCGCSYVCECVRRSLRAPALALLVCAAALGALLSAALASEALPQTGADALHENKEHFSAWHRYLLLCMLPLLASLFSLIWTPESPRYLLEVGREVDAMQTYQNIHRDNLIRVCGKENANVNAASASELALPGKRRPPVLHHVRHSLKMVWQSFFQLFSSAYRANTLTLAGMMIFALGIQFYLSAYVPATVVRRANEEFEASKRIIENVTFINENYNGTQENIQYANTTFINCTFHDMLLSHVKFLNVSFYNVALSNIKTSYTVFKGSTFVNSSLIDTDISPGMELDEWCTLLGTVVRGIRAACRPDLTSRLTPVITERVYTAHAALGAALVALLPLRTSVYAIQCAMLLLLTPSIYLVQSETALYVMEAAYYFVTTHIFFAISVDIINMYPSNLRCTAHGLFLSLSGLLGLFAHACSHLGPGHTTAICVLLAFAAFSISVKHYRNNK